MDDLAYFGRWGCDVPYSMVDIAMQKMKADNPNLDLILVPGDLIGHGISLELEGDQGLTPAQIDERYKKLLDTHRQVADLFEKNFGSLPVLPCFGNNDSKYNY